MVEKNQEHIRLFFLPAQIPERNPDERLNQDVKANADAKIRAKDQMDLTKNLRNYLKKEAAAADHRPKRFQRSCRPLFSGKEWK